MNIAELLRENSRISLYICFAKMLSVLLDSIFFTLVLA